MKVLLLDNKDSFTYNIVDYLRRMRNVDFEVVDSVVINLEQIEKYDKIIISPGPGLPADFPDIFKVLERYHKYKAILGICLGHQAIAQYFGASLSNISPVVHGQGHRVDFLDKTDIFKSIPDKSKVGLYHSWTVSEIGFPDKLKITAKSENGVIMGIASREYKVCGVQFHPESHITEYGFEILSNFIYDY